MPKPGFRKGSTRATRFAGVVLTKQTDGGNLFEIGQVLLGVLEDPGTAREYARTAQSVIPQHYSVAAMVERYRRLYASILAGKRVYLV